MTGTDEGRHDAGRPMLSIILGSVESAQTMPQALTALRKACRGLRHEIIVADASMDRSAALAEEFGGVTVLRYPPGTLVPLLWAAGIRRSRGRWIALTTGHCVVGDGWADALAEGFGRGAAAVGAGLLPLPGVRPLDDAVFFLRYAAFLPLTRGPVRAVEDVPGDNAAYLGDDLRDFVARGGEGFWEVEYHRDLLARGESILAVPEATAGFGRSFPFRTILSHRFDHGRHFGAWRAGDGGEGRIRVILPSPLVPPLMVARTARRIAAFPELRLRFARSLPAFLALAGAWAGGEAVGAVLPGAGSERGQ